jgi:hypothetical protein
MASSQNFFVWFCGVLICQGGLIPRLTKSCGISDPAEQTPAGYQTPRNNIQNEYFCEFEKEFKNSLECEFRDYMGSIRRKNQRSKISCYCPFKEDNRIRPNDSELTGRIRLRHISEKEKLN